MRTRLLTLLLLTLTSTHMHAASWLDRITLRESLDDKKVPQPAFFTLTKPHDAKSSYTAGIGLRIDLAPDRVSDKLQLGPFLEYAKNTETKKEQDNLKLGLSTDWTVRDISQERITWTPIVVGKLNYARDHIKKTTSAQATILLTPQPRAHAFDKAFWYYPNIQTDLGPVRFLYSPSIGLEDSDTLRAATSAEERNIVRAVGRFAITLTLNNDFLKDKLEYNLDLSYRRDLSSTTDRGHRFLQHTLNVFFFRDTDTDRSAGIGAAYVTGEDPSKGFQAQQFIRLGLVIRL